jgi:hypothetical protein
MSPAGRVVDGMVVSLTSPEASSERSVPDLNTRAVALGFAGLLALLAGVALVGGGAVRPFWLGETEFASAVASAPAGSERVSWTDWAGVRRELGTAVDARSDATELDAFLDAAFDADLTSRSALLQSADAMQSSFGFSPASAEWELFSQSPDGAVITLRLSDDADFAGLGDRLETLGYRPPASETGVWTGGPDLISSISPGLTPELAYLVLDADDRLVLASDQADYVEAAHRAADGDGDRVNGLEAVADELDKPLSAALYSGDYACGALAMAQADADDQAQAAELITAAGTLDPYLALAMGVLPGGDVRVAMEFANDDQARANAGSRAVLAAGPAVGQGGDFSERFTVRSARTDGSLVTLELRPAVGQYVLSDLSAGPVLFATC